MNVPFVVPEDDTTPYPADFERVVACVREMGYALDIIEEAVSYTHLTLPTT